MCSKVLPTAEQVLISVLGMVICSGVDVSTPKMANFMIKMLLFEAFRTEDIAKKSEFHVLESRINFLELKFPQNQPTNSSGAYDSPLLVLMNFSQWLMGSNFMRF